MELYKNQIIVNCTCVSPVSSYSTALNMIQSLRGIELGFRMVKPQPLFSDPLICDH